MNFFNRQSDDGGSVCSCFNRKDRLCMISVSEISFGSGLRRSFSKTGLSELAQSIRENGVVEPIAVKRLSNFDKDEKYELVFGERRLRGALIAGAEYIPCVVLPESFSRPKLYSLLENLQREDLTFFEQAEGISALINEYGMTRQEISQKLGLSEPAVSNKLRLLRLTPAQRESIENTGLTERHARTLLRICDTDMRSRALREFIDKTMNVDEAERFVDRLLLPKTQRKSKMIIRDIRLFVNSINKAVNVMKISGINARTERQEDDEYIKYTVLIPKRIDKLSIDNQSDIKVI